MTALSATTLYIRYISDLYAFFFVPSLVISLCRYIIFIMPIAWVLCGRMGPTGVWHAFWITEALSAVIAYAVYHKAVHQK